MALFGWTLVLAAAVYFAVTWFLKRRAEAKIYQNIPGLSRNPIFGTILHMGDVSGGQ